jgi:hypothetical protein
VVRALRRLLGNALANAAAVATTAAAALNGQQQQQHDASLLSIVLPEDDTAAAAGDGTAAGPATPTAREATLQRPGSSGSSTQRATASSSGAKHITLTIRVGGRCCSTKRRATRPHGRHYRCVWEGVA